MRLVEKFLQAARDQFIPWTATLELTIRCNLKCVHCYNLDRDRRLPQRPELTAAEWHDAVVQLRSAGCHQIGLTGGEALVHPSFFDLVEQAGDLGMAVGVSSNGTTLSDRAADRLAGFDHIVDVGLSLYGSLAKTHDAVTQVPGSFDRTMRGARRLRDAGVPVTLKLMVMDLNVREAGEMVERAEQESFGFELSAYIHPRHDGDRSAMDRRASFEDLEAQFRGGLRHTLPQPGEGSADGLICNCARTHCAISSTGDVFPCISVPMPCGNIRQRSFVEVWRDSPQLNWIRHLKPQDFQTCEPCPLKAYCQRNPGAAYVLHGDYTGIDPWMCRMAELVGDVVEGR